MAHHAYRNESDMQACFAREQGNSRESDAPDYLQSLTGNAEEVSVDREAAPSSSKHHQNNLNAPESSHSTSDHLLSFAKNNE